MLKRNHINHQMLLEELEVEQEERIEKEENESKILIFIEFIGLIMEFIVCFFQLIFYIILLLIIIGVFYAIFQ